MMEFKTNHTVIVKNKNVEYTSNGSTVKYNYASLDSMIKQIVSDLSRCGFTVDWKNETPKDKPEIINIVCYIKHVGGWVESTGLAAPPDKTGGKNSVQAIGSTTTYLQRYTLQLLLGIVAEDDDGQKADDKVLEYITEEQQASINEWLEATGSNEKKFLKWLSGQMSASAQRDIVIEKLSEIPLNWFDFSIKTLKDKGEK